VARNCQPESWQDERAKRRRWGWWQFWFCAAGDLDGGWESAGDNYKSKKGETASAPLILINSERLFR
jgi:hypothetical protein